MKNIHFGLLNLRIPVTPDTSGDILPIIQDDRTEEERETHDYIVIGYDPGMSGWGGAENRISYAGWACRVEDVLTVKKWVKSRGDIVGTHVVRSIRPKYNNSHVHVYVVYEEHPALEK